MASIIVPTTALFVVWAVYQKNLSLIYSGMFVWGIGFAFFQVSGLPFILRYSDKETHSESISLFFQMWPVTIFLSGIIYAVLSRVSPNIFDEGTMLGCFSALGFLAIPIILSMRVDESKMNEGKELSLNVRNYDWGRILKVVTPTLLIAIGAGFTIPVINLFFESVHGIPSESFAIYGAATYGLVAFGMTFMPFIRRKFGYGTAITLFQSLAVAALFFLAATEWIKHWEIAAGIAVFFYIIRQPLMNVAGPMTSELSMYYAGKRNHEIIAALNSSIWSGSWLFSMSMFSRLREWGIPYVNIFMITVALYIVGILWYVYLIRDYKKRTGSDGREIELSEELV